MSKLIRDTFYYTLGNILTKVFSFLLLPLYTAYLDPNQYGIWNSMQVLSSILAIFFSFGLERSIYRLYYDYKDENGRRNFLGSVIIGLLVISSFFLLLLYSFDNAIEKIYTSITFYPYYSYAILISYMSIFAIVPKIIIQVKEQAKKFFIISIFQLFANTLSVIFFVVIKNQGAIGMLKGVLVSHLITLPIFIFITLKSMNFYFRFELFQKSFMYSLPLVPGLMASWIYNLSDRIFIERYFSNYDVGLYSLGYKIGQLVQLIAISLLMSYNPYFYRLANSKDQQNARKQLYKTHNIYVLILLIIGFLVALFSKDIIVIFLDKDYYNAFKFTPIITLGYFFIQLIALQNLSFYQAKKTIIIMYITIFSAIINLILNFLLIPSHGILGAAYATLFTQIIYFTFIYIKARKYYFIPYNLKLILPFFILFIAIALLSNVYVKASVFSLIVKASIIFISSLIIYFKYKSQIMLFLFRQ